MDSEKGGLSSAERQRQTAAEIARKKVMAAYSSGQRSATSQSPLANARVNIRTTGPAVAATPGTRPIVQPVARPNAQPAAQPAAQSVVQAAVQPAAQSVAQSGVPASVVRKIPVSYQQTMTQIEQKSQKTGTMTEADWQKYHDAWQKYYQKYYSEYYAKAALAFVEKEKMRQARDASDKARNAENAIVQETAAPEETPKQVVEDSLRARVQQIAKKQQKKRLNKKLIPIIAGAVLVLALLFMQYNRLIFAPIMAYVSPGNTEDTGISEVDPTISVAVSDETKLLIPKLNIDVPLHLGIPNDEVMSAMNNGVAQFAVPGASAMPGEIGNLAISGHSAGDIYSSNQYKFIFSGLERLENGDLIYVDYEGTRYTYKMVDRKEVDPSDVNALVLNTDKPMLTLITCWPLGVSTYRLLIFAEQINPAPSGATQSATGVDEGDTSSGATSSDSSSEVMPKNEPTFFERIWNWLTGKSNN